MSPRWSTLMVIALPGPIHLAGHRQRCCWVLENPRRSFRRCYTGYQPVYANGPPLPCSAYGLRRWLRRTRMAGASPGHHAAALTALLLKERVTTFPRTTLPVERTRH